MNTRLASAVAAVVLSVGTLASPALAQSYTAPAGISAAAAPGSARNIRSYDNLTTGSINSVQAAPRADQRFAPASGRHHGPRGEPLAY